MSTPPKSSLIYDYLVAKCATLWPNKTRIFNPYQVARNDEQFLRDGFGVGFGGVSENPTTGRCLRLVQEYVIPISKVFRSLEHDAARRMQADKELVAELMNLVVELNRDQNLGGTAARTTFVSATAIDSVFSESQQFIHTTLTFSVEYMVNI